MSQISSKFIKDNAISTAKIANDAVDKAKIAADVAGAGLAQNGDGSLEVGAGSGISVAADSVAVDSTVIRTAGTNAFTADQSMGSFKLTNLAAPVSGGDAANKTYVDAAINGLDWKQSVRAATTGPLTLASDFENGDTLDGVVLATNDRILIKDQADGATNGIYTVNASGAPTRATDADVSAEVTAGLAVFVSEGTVNADNGFVLSTNDAIVLGTTALTFVQFNGAGQLIAGAGLTKTGNTIDVGAGNGIAVAADSIAVSADSTGGANLSRSINVSANGVAVKIDDTTIGENGSQRLQVKSNSISETHLTTSVAGAGLAGGNGTALSVNVDSSTTKITSDAVEALKQREQTITLIAGDITNQYVDLAFAAHGASASVNSVALSAEGVMQRKISDYTVSLTGGAGGVTRITFAGDLATGGNAALVATDSLVITYNYL